MKVSQEVAEFLESLLPPIPAVAVFTATGKTVGSHQASGTQTVELPSGRRLLLSVIGDCLTCHRLGSGEHVCDAEPSEFNLLLEAPGEAVVLTYKAIREITGLGLVESKELVDSISKRGPRYLKEGVSKQDAEEYLAKLQAAGAKGIIEPCEPSPPSVNMRSFGGPVG